MAFKRGQIGYWKGKKRPPFSKEWLEKIWLANNGFKKGNTIWKGRKQTEEAKGKKLTNEHKEKLKKNNSHYWLGKELTLEHKRKLSEAQKGEKGSNWQGGKTAIHLKIKNSLEYKLWRKAVFERDNYTCIFCGDNKGGNLEADHIKPFALFPELRFAIDNGRTLCRECHRKTNTYGGKTKRI